MKTIPKEIIYVKTYERQYRTDVRISTVSYENGNRTTGTQLSKLKTGHFGKRIFYFQQSHPTIKVQQKLQVNGKIWVVESNPNETKVGCDEVNTLFKLHELFELNMSYNRLTSFF